MARLTDKFSPKDLKGLKVTGRDVGDVAELSASIAQVVGKAHRPDRG
jgi:hypothetical protein